MKITSKGQVTIPQELRNKLGFFPGTEVEFIPEGNSLKLTKSKTAPGKGAKLIEQLKSKATIRLSTDEIMALTRGES